MKKTLTVLLTLITLTAQANIDNPTNKTFPVKNPPSFSVEGIDKAEFDKIITKVQKVYAPIVASNGGFLSIKRKWTDPTANSNTDEIGGYWYINAFGGLARHPMMTSDGYLMVLCHELYHHLGGYPKSIASAGWTNNASVHWASNEGQSDYGAALKCFKRMIQNDDNSFFNNCRAGRESECCKKPPRDAAICVRTVRAGISVSNALHDLAGSFEPYKISLETPDKTIVTKTDDSHPNAQCRMDTYYAGALCDADINTPFNNKSAIIGSCSEEHGDKIGVRPRCWYKPKDKVQPVKPKPKQ